MNERIKQLAEQARDYVADAIELGFPQDQIDDIRDEKFAELIVRMCADAADMYEGKSDCVGDCVAEYMGYGEAEGITEWRAK